VKNKIKKIFASFNPVEKYLIALFGLIIIGSALALGVQTYISKTTAVAVEGGEYREATVGSPRFINPILSSTNDIDRDLVSLIYSGLVTYDSAGNIVPDLAENFEISENGKEYKFTLKNNLVWEDEKPLTVDDVVFTIETIQNPRYSSPLYQSWQGIKVSKENENTVIFELSSAYPPFLENATLGILPKHIWESMDPQNFTLTDLNLQPIGSGPFSVEKFTKSNTGLISSYTLARNNSYHGKKPYINKITFKFYPTEEDAIRAYNSKAADGLSFLSPSNIELLRDTRSLNLHEFKIPRNFVIFFNQDKNPLLKSKNIREALYSATNQNTIIKDVLGGFGEVADSPIPVNLVKYYNENLQTPHYDLARARALLAQEGWEDLNNDGVREKLPDEDEDEDIAQQKLAFTLVTARRPELAKVAELIKQQWAEAGIELNINTMELGELQQNYIRPRSYEMLMFGMILGAIPDPYPFWHSSQAEDAGLNLAKYKSQTADTLLEQARRQTSEEKAIEQYKEFQEIVVEDIPVIFLYDSAYIYPINKGVQGIQPGFIVDSSHRFSDVSNWYIETKRVF